MTKQTALFGEFTPPISNYYQDKCETSRPAESLGASESVLVRVADGGGAEASEAVAVRRRRPPPPPPPPAQTPDRHSTSRRRHTHQLQQPSDPQKVTRRQTHSFGARDIYLDGFFIYTRTRGAHQYAMCVCWCVCVCVLLSLSRSLPLHWLND